MDQICDHIVVNGLKVGRVILGVGDQTREITDLSKIKEIYDLCNRVTNQPEGRESIDKNIYSEEYRRTGKKLKSKGVFTESDQPILRNPLIVSFLTIKRKENIIATFSVADDDWIRDNCNGLFYQSEGIYQKIYDYLAN